MQPVEQLYNASFFGRRNSLLWRAPILCDIIQEVFKIGLGHRCEAKIVDVGCAIGEFVAEFNRRAGISSLGFEGSKEALRFAVTDKIEIIDMRRRFDYNGKICDHQKAYHICLCLEVAEHIEEKFADNFVHNLCFLSNTVMISAAPPGQKGHGHVNCQPKSYWEKKFKLYDYERHKQHEKRLHSFLEPHRRRKGLSGYYNNIMIFWR